MPINLEDHKVYVDAHRMDMVPFSIAKQAVEEAVNKQLDEAIQKLSVELTSLKPDLSKLDD